MSYELTRFEDRCSETSVVIPHCNGKRNCIVRATSLECKMQEGLGGGGAAGRGGETNCAGRVSDGLMTDDACRGRAYRESNHALNERVVSAFPFSVLST